MITKEDIEQFRTTVELDNWVESIFLNNNTDEFASTIRLKSSVEIKTLMEEVIFIQKFSNKYFRSNSRIRIKPIIGNQSFDAIVEGCNEILYLEVTRAVNGYHEILRNEHLDEHGYVWAMGDIVVTGTKAKGSRFVEFKKEAVLHKDVLDDVKRLLKETILKKIRKQNKYNERTFLIVTFEDPFWDKLDVEDTDAINKLINEEIISLKHSFCGICIMGEHNNYFRII